MAIPFADNFLAGSLLTLLMPVGLLIAIAVWYVLSSSGSRTRPRPRRRCRPPTWSAAAHDRPADPPPASGA